MGLLGVRQSVAPDVGVLDVQWRALVAALSGPASVAETDVFKGSKADNV
jgi:hypothetical protein